MPLMSAASLGVYCWLEYGMPSLAGVAVGKSPFVITKFDSEVVISKRSYSSTKSHGCLLVLDCIPNFDSPPKKSLHSATGTPWVNAAAQTLPPLPMYDAVAPPRTIVARSKNRLSQKTFFPRGQTVTPARG
mmetsp:Transcript_19595/g.36577  ORF Transcript_19595/g.36577 Transcript_19595/m.36577 type:complete len:131 (+) Transcript_19595:962-1354(+)